MNKVLMVLGFLGLIIGTASAEWTLIPLETGRVAVATTGNTYDACTELPLTLPWDYIQAKVESVLDATGATVPGNAGLAVRLIKNSTTMPLQSATMATSYKVLLPVEALFEDMDQSDKSFYYAPEASVNTYYADTTLTAGDTTKINLIYDTWKLLR